MGSVSYRRIIASVTFSLLLFLRWRMGGDFFLLGRFFPFGEWIQIVLLTLFAGWIANRIYFREERPMLRLRLWTLFAVLFYLQLLLGIVADSRFLMSGELHFPVPSVILTGAVYRWEFGFMPILLLATILLSGGAWCSYLCYFGAFDAWAAGSGKYSRDSRRIIRNLFLLFFILVAIALRILDLPSLWATIGGALSGVIGVVIVVVLSRKKRTMVHCTYFCPVGTVVTWLKDLSPFRYRITESCTACMRCVKVCRYGALTPELIHKREINRNCTLCGDCQAVCGHQSFEYRFAGLSPIASERLFFGVVTVLYVLFLAVARV
ncbi:MAG: 4Fe-4S binding protein [Bacteroidales bacterium]